MTRQVGAHFYQRDLPSNRLATVLCLSICSLCVCVSKFQHVFCVWITFFVDVIKDVRGAAKKHNWRRLARREWKTHVWNADSMKKMRAAVCKLRNMEAKKYKKGKKSRTTIWDATNESREKPCNSCCTFFEKKILYYSFVSLPNEKSIEFKLKPIWRGKKWLNLEEKIGSQLLWVLRKAQILLLPTRALLVCSMSLCVLKIGSSQVNCSL